MKCVEMYKTVDGEVFSSEQKAKRHESDLLCQRLEKLLIAYFPDAHRPHVYKAVEAMNADRETARRYLKQVMEVIEYE